MGNLKNSLNFNKAERAGIVVLVILIIIAVAVPYFIHTHFANDPEVLKKFIEDINRFELSIKKQGDSLEQQRQLDFQQMDRSIAENRINPFPFNPNALPSEQWSKLGLKDWQIKMIKNYEAKGGKFYKKEDVRKMYCISPTEYSLLEPFIVIPEQKPAFSEPKTAPKPAVVRVLVDLNTADSVALLDLYGIGTSFAKRIVKYRNLLGGFYSKDQLLEVYGFDQERLGKIESYISVGGGVVKKLNINILRTDDLKKHPYLDYYTAKAIVDRRISKGKFTSLEQLKEIPLIHEELFNKIKNYLSLD